MKVFITFLYIIFIFQVFSQNKTTESTFTDNRDGKTYQIIKIGNQTWMAENLAYKVDSGCWAYNNDTGNVSVYGYLYSWNAAKVACPVGWHLPGDGEWTILIDYIGGSKVAGAKLKSLDIWDSPGIGATNATGFNAFPGGFRNYDKETFVNIGVNGCWWSSTTFLDMYAWSRYLYNDGSNVERNCSRYSFGFSVRCVRDKK